MPEFILKKWYLDYISPDFNASIIYKGSLRYGPFEVHHCSELKKSNGLITNDIFWDNKKCSVDVSSDLVECKFREKTFLWKSRCNPFSTTIFENGNKYIRWNCLQPLSKVEFVGNETNQQRFGYVEYLETNILPWEFEFDHLIWGRFTNENTSVVWIDIQGVYSKQLILLNGDEVKTGIISSSEIIFERGSIKIQDLVVLREGRLMSTLLTNMPFLKQIIPKAGIPLYEQKFLSKGFLTIDNQIQEGQIIHEIIRWK